MEDERRVIDPGTLESRELSFLLNAIVVPRPIAWISTISHAGTPNLAPHSYNTVLSQDPPVIGFVSVGEKDTLRNVRQTGDFVYNMVGEDLLDQINLSSANFLPDESEFAWTGLTPVPSDIARSPRVGEAPLSMEARLIEILPIAGGASYLVIGAVVRFHIAERVLTGDRIDQNKLRPAARLSGSQYSLHGEVISLKRPTRQMLLDGGITSRGTAPD
jgi:flavin reductase (DIM6/NTAB) family NADH-FMN oxidoreductase RutF